MVVTRVQINLVKWNSRPSTTRAPQTLPTPSHHLPSPFLASPIPLMLSHPFHNLPSPSSRVHVTLNSYTQSSPLLYLLLLSSQLIPLTQVFPSYLLYNPDCNPPYFHPPCSLLRPHFHPTPTRLAIYSTASCALPLSPLCSPALQASPREIPGCSICPPET